MSRGAAASDESPPPRRLALRTVDEACDYTSAVAGVTVEAIRVGQGKGPNVVLGVSSDCVTVTSSHFGFPMTAGAHVPPDRVLAAFVHENPGGSRWCGTVLRPGSVIIYPPGAEHAAINHPGTHFTFAITEPEYLMALSDRLGIPTEIPPAPRLNEIRPSGVVDDFGATMRGMSQAAVIGDRLEHHAEAVLAAFARLLAGDPPATTRGPSRGFEDRAIVSDCVDYAEAIERIPRISELCAAAHVSERRLRSAFYAEFDRSPTRFFRTWALGRAHDVLRNSSPDDCTVAQIACDLGFSHLGRFSGWYRDVYGQPPSHTHQLT